MKIFNSISKIKECLYYNFDVIRIRDYKNSCIQTFTYSIYDMNFDDITEERIYILILGELMCKYGDCIFIEQYNIVNISIDYVIKNYEQFTISEEEKQEIYGYALKLKEELPKLKIEYDPHAE